MKNNFELRDGYAAIFLQEIDGARLETKISLDDVDRVSQFPGRWVGMWSPFTVSWYSVGMQRGKKAIPMARFILGTPPLLEADHIHHDTLDNRRSELRSITHARNRQNSKIQDAAQRRELITSRWKGIQAGKLFAKTARSQ